MARERGREGERRRKEADGTRERGKEGRRQGKSASESKRDVRTGPDPSDAIHEAKIHSMRLSSAHGSPPLIASRQCHEPA